MFADQQPPKIELPPEDLEKLEKEKGNWVQVRDVKGELHVLRIK
jgi:anaerobic selenocysteine-containing dehydrogenase